MEENINQQGPQEQPAAPAPKAEGSDVEKKQSYGNRGIYHSAIVLYPASF